MAEKDGEQRERKQRLTRTPPYTAYQTSNEQQSNFWAKQGDPGAGKSDALGLHPVRHRLAGLASR